MIYNLIFIILLFLSLLEIFFLTKIRWTRKYVMIFLWLFGSFSMVGIDIKGYQAYYLKQVTFVEKGYLILNKNLYNIFNGEILGFYVLLGILGGLNLYFMYKNFEYYTPYFYTALLICYKWFFLGNILGGSRQGLVVMVFIYSLKFVGRSKIKYFIFNISMYLIHRTSIILLPIYIFLRKKNRSLINILMIIVVSFILSKYEIVNYIEKIVRILPLPSEITSLFYGYLSDSDYNSRREMSIMTYLVSTYILFFSIYYRRKLQKFKEFEILLNTYLLYIIFQYGFSSIYILSYRLSEYFRNIDAILISLFLTIYRKKRNKLFMWTIICIYVIISYSRYIQHPTYKEYFNYILKNIW